MKAKILLLAMACACAAAVQAQTPPAAKPAATAGGKTLSMGKGTANSPLLTRDELRACLKQEESLRSRLDDLETRRAPLLKEKEEVSAAQQALRAEMGPVDDVKKRVEDYKVRRKDFEARAAALTERINTFNAAPPASKGKADKEREDISRERDEVLAQQKVLETETAELGSSSQTVIAAYNAKATAVDAKVSAWNQRNEQLNQESKALEAERATWVSNCSERRYREDDETAIKRGK